MSAETTQSYASHLVELFKNQTKDPQVKFDVDFAQATGLHAGQDGIIAVPVKGLKEEAVDPAVETENGAGLCVLFLSTCYAPTLEGKPIDAKKLRRFKYNDGQGGEREALCLLVSVKHVGGDDWRLLAFGTEAKPVIDSTFSEATESTDKQLTIKVSGAKDKKAKLGFTVFKKYSASFGIEVK